jgi:hypothetical protein
MRTVSTAGGAPIRLTCFSHHGLPRAARLGRVSGLFNRARANGIDLSFCRISPPGNREKGKMGGGRKEMGVRLVPSPAARRLDDKLLVTNSAVTVEFSMREHVPDDRA